MGPSGDINPSSATPSASDVLSPSSFSSYGLEDPLEARRSPNPSSLRSSRMNSRDSLLNGQLTSSLKPAHGTLVQKKALVGNVYATPLMEATSNSSKWHRLDKFLCHAFGLRNAFFQVDDVGVYFSRAAITVAIGIVGSIGIILLTLVVTLALELGKCHKHPGVNSCASFNLNSEINNLQGYFLPPECSSFVARYVDSGQYYVDFAVAVEAARQYLNALQIQHDGRDLVILDIDETSLSNIPYYARHHYGVEAWNELSWRVWVNNAIAPALDPMLSLYRDLRSQNWSVAFITGRSESMGPKTALNLHNAGYRDWTTLILRMPEEEKLTIVQYKSMYRRRLANEGYRIRSSLGDQWSDLEGGSTGERTFKMPNPMYYIH